MAEILNTGFEVGDPAFTGSNVDAGWTLDGTDGTNPCHGSRNLKITTPNNGETNKDCHYYHTVTGNNPVCIRVKNARWHDFSDLFAGYDQSLLGVGQATGGTSYIAKAGIHNDSGTRKWWMRYLTGGGYASAYGGVTTPNTNTNYCMELRVYRHGSAGYAKLYIDDVLEIDITGIDNDAYTLSNAYVGCVSSDSGWPNAMTITADCCIIADAAIGCTEVSGQQLFTLITMEDY